MEKRFGKSDKWLLLILAVGLLVGCLIFYALGVKKGAEVTVTVAGELYGTYSLEKDAVIEIQINGSVTNRLEIKDKKASVTEASCPDKLCVHQKAISKTNETIVCLPNKVVIEILDADVSDFDSMT